MVYLSLKIMDILSDVFYLFKQSLYFILYREYLWSLTFYLIYCCIVILHRFLSFVDEILISLNIITIFHILN